MDSNILDRLAVADDPPDQPRLPQASKPRAERFVRAPLAWIQAAGRLPGKACQVGAALRFLSGVERSNTVRLSQDLCDAFGVDRFSMYRALNSLEAASLVRVVRKPGRLPVVTLLPVPTAAEARP